MRPCPPYQKPIAWLALDVLDSQATAALQVHLADCPRCRQHLEEMLALTKNLDALRVLAEVQASSAFHQKLMQRLEAEAPVSMWEILTLRFRSAAFNWQIALPVVVVMLAVFFVARQSPAPPSASMATPVAVASPAPEELAPTIANYQHAASQSSEEFNALLTEQGRQNLSSTPLYTASTLLSAL